MQLRQHWISPLLVQSLMSTESPALSILRRVLMCLTCFSGATWQILPANGCVQEGAGVKSGKEQLHNLAVLSSAKLWSYARMSKDSNHVIYPSLKYSNNRNAVINNTIKSVNTNNTLPKQISVEFFLSFIRKRRTRKAFIVTNKVITNVGTNVNKNLPMITLTGDAFQAERASSLVPK